MIPKPPCRRCSKRTRHSSPLKSPWLATSPAAQEQTAHAGIFALLFRTASGAAARSLFLHAATTRSRAVERRCEGEGTLLRCAPPTAAFPLRRQSRESDHIFKASEASNNTLVPEQSTPMLNFLTGYSDRVGADATSAVKKNCPAEPFPPAIQPGALPQGACRLEKLKLEFLPACNSNGPQ